MRYSSLLLFPLFLLAGCLPVDQLTDDGQSITANATLPTQITTQTAITVRFSAPVPSDTVFSDYLAVSPAIDGDYTLAQDQLSVTFTPDPGWQPGMTYRISLSDRVALNSGDYFAAAQWRLDVEDWTDPALIEATDGWVSAWSVASDRMGNVYVAGSVVGTIANNEAQPATGFYGLTPLFYEQGYVQKYSPSGERLWTRLLDAPFSVPEGVDNVATAYDMLIDHNGYLRVMTRGHFNNEIPAQIITLDTNGNTQPGSLLLVDSEVDAESVWVDPLSMAMASDGTLYLYGQTNGSIDGTESGRQFIAQYSASADLNWVRQFDATALTEGSPASASVWDMTVGEDGSVTLNLSTNAEVLGSEPIWDSVTPVRNGMLVQFDTLGNIDWIERFGHNDVILWAVASETVENGDILASYEFYSAPSGATVNGTALNATDGMLLVRYSAQGVHQSTTVYPNNGGWTGINDMVRTSDNTLVGIGFYMNETTPTQNWLTEWDAQGNLLSQRFNATLPADYDLQLTEDPWGQWFTSARQDGGVVLKRMSFD